MIRVVDNDGVHAEMWLEGTKTIIEAWIVKAFLLSKSVKAVIKIAPAYLSLMV